MTWEEINKKATGGAITQPSPKPIRTWSELNSYAKETYIVPPSPALPEEPTKPTAKQWGLTLTAPTVRPEAPAGERITAPLMTGATAQAPGIFGLMQPFAKAGMRGFNVISEATTGFVNRLDKFFDVISDKEVRPVEKILAGTEAIMGGAGVAFTPITATLDAAEEIPLLKYPAKAVNWGFQKLGEAGSFVAGKAIDVIPMEEADRAMIKPVAQEVAGFLAQYAGIKGGSRAIFGKGISATESDILRKSKEAPDSMTLVERAKFDTLTKRLADPGVWDQGLLKTFTDKVFKKTGERKKEGIPITSSESQKIVSETVKEIPMPGDRGTMTIGETKVGTDQLTVLRNLIKGQENLDYIRVNSLGKDTVTGEPIMARFEWDYNKQKGTIYSTKETTAENIAHEVGHYLDRKVSTEIGQRISDILPEYALRKEPVESSLSAYVVAKNKGTISGERMQTEMVKTIKDIEEGIVKLTPGDKPLARNQRFANAVREVLNRPDESRQVAPAFTDFIEYYLVKDDIVAKRIKETGAKTTEAVAGAGKEKTGSVYR